jgi:hypothetical protein
VGSFVNPGARRACVRTLAPDTEKNQRTDGPVNFIENLRWVVGFSRAWACVLNFKVRMPEAAFKLDGENVLGGLFVSFVIAGIFQ